MEFQSAGLGCYRDFVDSYSPNDPPPRRTAAEDPSDYETTKPQF